MELINFAVTADTTLNLFFSIPLTMAVIVAPIFGAFSLMTR